MWLAMEPGWARTLRAQPLSLPLPAWRGLCHVPTITAGMANGALAWWLQEGALELAPTDQQPLGPSGVQPPAHALAVPYIL